MLVQVIFVQRWMEKTHVMCSYSLFLEIDIFAIDIQYTERYDMADIYMLAREDQYTNISNIQVMKQSNCISKPHRRKKYTSTHLKGFGYTSGDNIFRTLSLVQTLK